MLAFRCIFLAVSRLEVNKISLALFTVLIAGGIAYRLISSQESKLTVANCENIRESMIELSEKDRIHNGYAIMKIYDPVEVSQSPKELVCRGEASYTDGGRGGMTYKAYVDEEGELIFRFEPDN